jgi:hypothetical protein
LAGIKKVTRGFRSLREINTVTYNDQQISPETMISALEKAGTFIGVAE